ncbi:MAG: P22 coat protein [Ruminococcaceae bacterium]|nr:P22 coat protein [Oscillospiraceae bacterium]
MANSIVTLRDIARTALPHLMNNLVFPRLVHSDFSDALAAKQGDTVQVRKPVNYIARDFDPDAGTQTQELEEGSVEVKLDKIASVDIEVSALDAALNFDSIDRLFIEPAAIALAEKLNADGLALYRDIAATVGTAGKTPSELSDLAAVRGALNDALVPQAPRYAVWDTAADTAFATVPALVNAEKSGSTDALREGALGRVFGIDNYMSQAVVKHETGITAADGVTVKSKAAEGAQTLDLTGTTLTGYLKAGDLMQIGGKNYTVVEDTAAAASNTISGVKVTPALPALTAGTAVTLIGSHTANLAFHPSAFAFVTRPLSEPAGVESYVTSFDGISLRVVRGYDMKYKREMLSMDVLYAYKTIYPELAVRCLG